MHCPSRPLSQYNTCWSFHLSGIVGVTFLCSENKMCPAIKTRYANLLLASLSFSISASLNLLISLCLPPTPSLYSTSFSQVAGLVQDVQQSSSALNESVADRASIEADRNAARLEVEALRAQVRPLVAGTAEADPAKALAALTDRGRENRHLVLGRRLCWIRGQWSCSAC